MGTRDQRTWSEARAPCAFIVDAKHPDVDERVHEQKREGLPTSLHSCRPALSTGSSLTDSGGELADLLVTGLSFLHLLADLARGMNHRRVIPAPEALTDLGQ